MNDSNLWLHANVPSFCGREMCEGRSILAELIGRWRSDWVRHFIWRDGSRRIGFFGNFGPLHMAMRNCDQIASQYRVDGSRGAQPLHTHGCDLR